MKEWFNRTFFTDEPLGDKILSVLIGIFAILFVAGWAIFLLWFVLNSLLDFIKWIYRKLGYSNYALEDKIDSIAEGIGKVFRLPLKLIPDSVDSFFYYKKVELRLIKSIMVGVSIPTIAILIWLVSSLSPIKDYLLITNSTTTTGTITKAEEFSDVAETNNGRTSEQYYFFVFDYSFVLPNGNKMESSGQEYGTLPDYLSELSSNPYQVEVEYLSDNPKENRIKGMDSNDNTILQWIRHKVVIGAIIILLCCYWGFSIIGNGFKEYVNPQRND